MTDFKHVHVEQDNAGPYRTRFWIVDTFIPLEIRGTHECVMMPEWADTLPKYQAVVSNFYSKLVAMAPAYYGQHPAIQWAMARPDDAVVVYSTEAVTCPYQCREDMQRSPGFGQVRLMSKATTRVVATVIIDKVSKSDEFRTKFGYNNLALSTAGAVLDPESYPLPFEHLMPPELLSRLHASTGRKPEPTTVPGKTGQHSITVELDEVAEVWSDLATIAMAKAPDEKIAHEYEIYVDRNDAKRFCVMAEAWRVPGTEFDDDEDLEATFGEPARKPDLSSLKSALSPQWEDEEACDPIAAVMFLLDEPVVSWIAERQDHLTLFPYQIVRSFDEVLGFIIEFKDRVDAEQFVTAFKS